MENDTKMKEILEILKGFSERNKNSKNLAETIDYIIDAESLAMFMFVLEKTAENFGGTKEDAQRHIILGSLVVGYHLGINKTKEVN
ncbi:hypothetical protein LCGC14_2779270 [marine sediment metagenome]|uniref:Uncharacterized protein n=1 Tax=marine sediment metagenome TaxID=412755 RepID=A0A0F8YTR0_9ZZZZ|nr:hypothetical protein [bacterium]